MIFIFFSGAIYFQSVYIHAKDGALILNEVCPWCKDDKKVDEIIYIPLNASHVRLLAPADPDFISDLLWIRTAYYFGLNSIKKGNNDYLFDLLNLVTDLSPKWEIPYIYAAILLPAEVGDVESGLYLIDKGLVNLSDNWELWFLKGYYLWKVHSDNVAAYEAFQRASIIEGAPHYLAGLSVTHLAETTNNNMEKSYREQVRKTKIIPANKMFD